VFALQVRQPVDELEDVVRPVILGEAGTAANGAEPALQSDVGESANRLLSAVAERNAVIGSSGFSGTIGCFKLLEETVVAKAGAVDQSGSCNVIPLQTYKMNVSSVRRTPVRLGDVLRIDDGPGVRAEEVLAIDNVLLVNVVVDLAKRALHGIVSGQIRANSVSGTAAVEAGIQFEYRVA